MSRIFKTGVTPMSRVGAGEGEGGGRGGKGPLLLDYTPEIES